MSDVELAVVSAEAAVQRALDSSVVPIVRQGTVTARDLANFIPSVLMDGDDVAIEAHDITQLGVEAGMRVNVLFAPPHQALIIGHIHGNWHVVGSGNGEPDFNLGWANHASADTFDVDAPPDVMFKRMGNFIEIRGRPVRAFGGDPTIFTLPVGFRPRNQLWYTQNGNGGTLAIVGVLQIGSVQVFAGLPGPIDLMIHFTTE